MRIAEKQIARHGRTVDAVYYIPDAPHGGTVIFSHGYNGHKSDFAREAEYLAKNGVCAVTYTFCGGSTRRHRRNIPSMVLTKSSPCW